MNIHWYGITYKCPECKVDVPTREVHYSSDGQLRILGECPTCKQPVNYEVFMSQLICQATNTDLSKFLGKCKEVPPMSVPKGLTKEDLKFLKEFHIADEEAK